VTGKVSFDGQPLPSGSVTFEGPKGLTTAGEIKDGVYTAKGAEIGPNKITVHTTTGKVAAMKEKMPKGPDLPMVPTPTEGVEIPKKYGAPATSGLSLDVKTGKQTYDIQLTK
jgi:hypothetical protein